MDRKPTSSSNIVSVGYDEEESILEIEFDNGVYQYSGVPKEVCEGLMNAGSAGRYFHQNIKGTYPCDKIE